jgi:hypothetical protein
MSRSIFTDAALIVALVLCIALVSIIAWRTRAPVAPPDYVTSGTFDPRIVAAR